MAVNGGRYFEINMKVQNYETQFIYKDMHTLAFLTTAKFVYDLNNHFMRLF